MSGTPQSKHVGRFHSELRKPINQPTIRMLKNLALGFAQPVADACIHHNRIGTFEIQRADQIQPFTADQVNALLRAAKRSNVHHARRDEAILWTLFDTGIRASELCGLRRGDGLC